MISLLLDCIALTFFLGGMEKTVHKCKMPQSSIFVKTLNRMRR